MIYLEENKMKLTKSQLKEMIREEMQSLNETAPMGKIDKVKFMKYFDLALKTAGTDKADIYRTLKKMMPSLDTRALLYMAQGIEDAVTQMTGGGK
tara:strand:- start:48 stop:332 length:285 start_codon:yes stop_codon:yes gene_type:complete